MSTTTTATTAAAAGGRTRASGRPIWLAALRMAGAAALVACAATPAPTPAPLVALASSPPPPPGAAMSTGPEPDSLDPISPFVGSWRAHSFTLIVERDGTAVADWRTYRWCNRGAAPPCDEMREGRISPGGHAALVFGGVENGWASGEVLASTDPATLPLTSVRLLLAEGGRVRIVVGLDDRQSTRVELCGPRAEWSTACGA